jgi:hypothetical protein
MDRELDFWYWVLIAVSACLTFYFGWTQGENVFPLNLVLGIGGAGVSFLSGLLARWTAQSIAEGYRFMAVLCAVSAATALFLDVMSNYGAAVAFRENNMKAAENVNRVANDAAERVQELEGTLAKIRENKAWNHTTLETPGVYEAKIAQLKSKIDKRGRRIYDRSKQCLDVTLPESEALCAQIRSAQGELSLATERVFLRKRETEVMAELRQARGESAEKPNVASAVRAQVFGLARMLTGKLEPSEGEKIWTNVGIAAGFAMAISVLAFVLGIIKGFLKGMRISRGTGGLSGFGTTGPDGFDPNRPQFQRAGFVEDRRTAYDKEVQDGGARAYHRDADTGSVNVEIGPTVVPQSPQPGPKPSTKVDTSSLRKEVEELAVMLNPYNLPDTPNRA